MSICGTVIKKQSQDVTYMRFLEHFHITCDVLTTLQSYMRKIEISPLWMKKPSELPKLQWEISVGDRVEISITNHRFYPLQHSGLCSLSMHFLGLCFPLSVCCWQFGGSFSRCILQAVQLSEWKTLAEQL